MTNALILALAVSCIPACHAITAAHRAGARGWLPYVVWLLEESAERLRRAALFLRDFHAVRQSRMLLEEERNAGNWSPAVGAASSANSPAVLGSSSIAAGLEAR